MLWGLRWGDGWWYVFEANEIINECLVYYIVHPYTHTHTHLI